MPEVFDNTESEYGFNTSDELHNINCYLYLVELFKVVPPFLKENFREYLEINYFDIYKSGEYNNTYPHGNNYTRFILHLEKHLDTFDTLADADDKRKQLRAFYRAVFINDNNILKKLYENLKNIVSEVNPTHSSAKETISHSLTDRPSEQNNNQTPYTEGRDFQLLLTLLSENFKPQKGTNIPTVRRYGYQQTEGLTERRYGCQPQRRTEIRMPTQAERDAKGYRPNPLFEKFLKSLEEGETHVYFNNLTLDGSTPPPLLSEQELSKQLHILEGKHNNIAVITLPAQGGLMAKDDYKCTKANLAYTDVYNQFISIVEGKQNGNFKISQRKLLNKEDIALLLYNSFNKLGINQSGKLSPAQRQAVWFHFIKFELTDHLLTELKATSYNFSCKDAIDRGGVHSAYYNLLKSFSTDCPMTEDEFGEAIYAAPAMVKGRGMNFHINLLWNTVDAYVNANFDTLIDDNKKDWLVHWRDMHCPSERVEKLLPLRIAQAKRWLETDHQHPLAEKHPTAISRALEIISTVKVLQKNNVSGKRLLLETASLTHTLAQGSLNNAAPNKKHLERYKELQKELELEMDPFFYVLVGLMESFIGILLYLPSLGYSQPMISKGLSTANTGFFAHSRQKMMDQMENLPDSESDEPTLP